MREIHDLIGIGTGPMNLALAIALQEKPSRDGRFAKSHFFEQRTEFSWHPGMMLRGATVQVSFLKDLVTLRNPCSPYSFINYLKSQGRLEHFVNLKEWYPSRIEFSHYFQWVAEALGEHISYGCRATGIEVVNVDGQDAFAVTIHDLTHGRLRTVYARNLSLACGGTPNLPPFARVHQHHASVCHSSTFLTKVAPFLKSPDQPHRFTIVGRGQSAAEIAAFLLDHFPNGSVTVVMQGYSFMAVDDNPFMNEIFFNAGVDLFSESSDEVRADLRDESKRTNYSVADTDVLESLHKAIYADRVIGRTRLRVRNLASVVDLDAMADGSTVQIHDKRDDERTALLADLTIFATGYVRTEASSLISGLQPLLHHTTKGSVSIDRFGRLEGRGLRNLQIFLQGESEDVHGISNTLLSVLPFRGGEIADLVRSSMNQSTSESYHAAA